MDANLEDHSGVDEREEPVKIPNPLHERCFVELMKYRESNPSFSFWLREKNTNNRLNEGYWFQGTEYYAHAGLYTTNSGNKSTKAVGLVFWPNEGTKIGLMFEVLHRNERSKKRLEFYGWLRELMKKDFGSSYEDLGRERFKVHLTNEEPFESAFEFLDKYSEQMAAMLRKMGLEDFFIDHDQFENKLANIQKRREAISKGEYEPGEFQDAVVDDEELRAEIEAGQLFLENRKYRHLTSSEIRPVIGVVDLAEELADFLTNLKGEVPILIGLFGRWGRGKTFLFEQIWEKLRLKKHFYKVEFHAWKHQQTPASWGYMYEAVANQYYKTNWVRRQWRIIRLNFRRNGFWPVIFLIVVIVGGILVGFKDLLPPNFSWEAFGLVSSSVVLAAIVSVMRDWKKNSTEAKALYKKYTQKHSYTNLLGIQAEVQTELKKLLNTWIKEKPEWFWKMGWPPYSKRRDDENNIVLKVKKRVLLFVDDIDRCSEDRIIEVVDALRVMLEDPDISKRIIVLAAIDETILRRAIRIKYAKLLAQEEVGDETKLNTLTKEYLDKLFLSGVKLGNLSQNQRLAIFGSLTEGKVEKPKEEAESEMASSDASRQQSQSSETADANTSENNETKEPDKKDDSSGESEETFEISLIEEKFLSEAIAELDEITPRQIRIFYLRYLLGRELLKKIKKHPVQDEAEIRALISVMTFVYDKDIIDQSISAILEEYIEDTTFPEVWNDLNVKKKEDFLEVLEMVVPY